MVHTYIHTETKSTEERIPIPRKVNWKPWKRELAAYKIKSTQGYYKDLLNLDSHIRRLEKAAPKDKAGIPELEAIIVLDKLKLSLEHARKWGD